MSQEKKVLSLILLLIILIVACTYTHMDTIKIEKIEQKPIVITEPIKEEEIVEKEPIIQEEPQIVEEEKIVIEEEVIEEPLIKTNTLYKREDGEFKIEDLSKSSQLLQIEINEYIKNNPIVFERSAYKITKKSEKTIDKIVEILNSNPTIKIEIAGHTDAAGEKKVNQLISQERARVVSVKLISKGIDKERMVVRGYGENIPLVENSLKGYSKINRRVEFNIIGE